MPRHHKPPLIQKIARQAHVTWGGSKGPDGADRTEDLLALVSRVRASDLKLVPRGSGPELGAPPVSYMHICETENFSMGVFLLRGGASIPLHDHPDMHGMLKVLYGKVRVRCFDKLQDTLTVGVTPPYFEPPLAPFQTASLRCAVLRSVGEFCEQSGPCVLTPVRDNLHQIEALDGSAAFLDILAPPYNPDDGRDCHYYKVLQTAAEGGACGKREGQGQEKEEKEAWLLEIPQPEEFWCGGESYPGPAVDI